MSDEKVVKLVHQETVPKDRVQEWIDANALPGDTVVVTLVRKWCRNAKVG